MCRRSTAASARAGTQVSLIAPLPSYAYPLLVATFIGLIWTAHGGPDVTLFFCRKQEDFQEKQAGD